MFEDLVYFEGEPYRGKSRMMPLIGINYRQETSSMQRVRLVVPFHTTAGTNNADGFDEDTDLDQDETLNQVNVEVRARYAIQDAAEAQNLLAAAEALGFRCTYDSGDPNKDDELGTVTITMPGIAE